MEETIVIKTLLFLAAEFYNFYFTISILLFLLLFLILQKKTKVHNMAENRCSSDDGEDNDEKNESNYYGILLFETRRTWISRLNISLQEKE